MARHDDVLGEVRKAIDNEQDATRAIEATVATLRNRMPDYSWVGVYLLEGNELVLGPYVGKPSPHTHIPVGRGICGAAAAEKATIIVDDVNADPRYLACSLDTKSEIVVPIMRDGNVLGEIDIDSDRHAAFGDGDRQMLESVAGLVAERLEK
ncbi:MAG: GAF domain-containing protein [Vicinamibacterales bacterium]